MIYHEAGHPFPNEASVAGTRMILAMVDGLTAEDLVVSLISGGRSAIIAMPRKGISLQDKREATELLIGSKRRQFSDV